MLPFPRSILAVNNLLHQSQQQRYTQIVSHLESAESQLENVRIFRRETWAHKRKKKDVKGILSLIMLQAQYYCQKITAIQVMTGIVVDSGSKCPTGPTTQNFTNFSWINSI